jgi:hypothetical protein
MGAPAATRWLRAVNDVVVTASSSPAGLKPSGRQRPSDKPFRSTGRKKARDELDKLVEAADALIECVADLHAPAIDVLADRGMMRGSITTFARTIATAAREADVSAVPEKIKRGDETDVRYASTLARLLYHHFAILTGQRPTVRVSDGKAYGPFLTLLREVFAALEIKVSPESQARAAIKAMEKRGGDKEAENSFRQIIRRLLPHHPSPDRTIGHGLARRRHASAPVRTHTHGITKAKSACA